MRTWKKPLGMSLPFMMLALGACNPAPESARRPTPSHGVCDDTATSQFVARQLTLPSLTRSYAMDLDGDGSTDNRFQPLFVGLRAVGFDSQALVNNMVARGRGMTLVEVLGSARTSGCSAAVRLQPAQQPAMPPRYDGRDAFSVKPGHSALSLEGTVSDGTLGTTSPLDLQGTEVAPLRIYVSLFEGVTIPLDLYGVQLEGTLNDDGTLEGELHAVLRKQDIDEQVIPAMAEALTAKVHKDPEDPMALAITTFFEDQDHASSKAKCDTEPERCCAKSPTTCDISVAELRENTLLMASLEPDVQMFQDGVWSPTPEGTAKDSVSIGFGISAVQASFELAPETLSDR
jgi:hypothetical protein